MHDLADTQAPASLAEQARRLLELKAELEAAEEAAEKLKARFEQEKRQFADEMAVQGAQNIKLDNGSTIYLARNIFPSKAAGVDTASLIGELERLGLGDFTTRGVNYQGLRSYIRELDQKHQEEHPGSSSGDAIPESLRPMLRLHEEVTVRVLKAPK